MKKPEQIKTRLLICVMFLSLTGCGMAIALAPSLIQAGAGAVSGLENVEVKAALSPGITADDLNKIKRVAVILGTGDQSQSKSPMFGGGGDITNVMSDNIALELMNLGYQVVERTSLDKVFKEEEYQMSGIVDPKTAAKVGMVLGIDAVVVGSITTSQNTKVSAGFMGMGSGVTNKQVISNVTMKVIGIQQADVIMIVALSYKKGQEPTEAAKTMAIALNEKLKNPTGEKEKVGAK